MDRLWHPFPSLCPAYPGLEQSLSPAQCYSCCGLCFVSLLGWQRKHCLSLLVPGCFQQTSASMGKGLEEPQSLRPCSVSKCFPAVVLSEVTIPHDYMVPGPFSGPSKGLSVPWVLGFSTLCAFPSSMNGCLGVGEMADLLGIPLLSTSCLSLYHHRNIEVINRSLAP